MGAVEVVDRWKSVRRSRGVSRRMLNRRSGRACSGAWTAEALIEALTERLRDRGMLRWPERIRQAKRATILLGEGHPYALKWAGRCRWEVERWG